MTLVTAEQLFAYMGGFQATPQQRQHVDDVVLPGVQGELERRLNRPVEPVHVREAKTPDDLGWIYFSVTPVWQVLRVYRTDGEEVPLQPTYTPVPLLPYPGVDRVVDKVGLGMTDQPYRYNVGVFAFQMNHPILVQPSYFIAEYIGGYDGRQDEPLKLAIMRVAAREVEQLFDTTLSLRGGAQESASDSDNRPKGWTNEEIADLSRLRHRVIVR